ncbi:hypothetical protein A2852_01455 [Candidatus Adlerbacteria bacterium RIFCSPHIGHO2_01_FULL_54_23]|nr:MAG: hypothetical protein A2852_01455 [Candidatus Adlerbacteria bacterium RIFCSPHIGHO2_01_FULL_54_23]
MLEEEDVGVVFSTFVTIIVVWIFIGPLLIEPPADYATAIACSVQHPFMNNAQLLKTCPEIKKK